jgi:hypothetical protein
VIAFAVECETRLGGSVELSDECVATGGRRLPFESGHVVTYPDSFFDALGRWQRGWKRDPVLRGSLAKNLVRETKRLPDALRRHDGRALYRKRNLYRSEDQAELIPLFMQGDLDEGSPTSWSTDLGFAERFGKIFDDHSPNSVAGAIFRHVPADDEVVLNIQRLWLTVTRSDSTPPRLRI